MPNFGASTITDVNNHSSDTFTNNWTSTDARDDETKERLNLKIKENVHLKNNLKRAKDDINDLNHINKVQHDVILGLKESLFTEKAKCTLFKATKEESEKKLLDIEKY
jgi:hypothetical protein